MIALTARDELIKIAYQHPALRPQLLPLIIKTAGLDQIIVAADKEGMQSGTAKGIATWAAIAAVLVGGWGAFKIFGGGKDTTLEKLPDQNITNVYVRVDGGAIPVNPDGKPTVQQKAELAEGAAKGAPMELVFETADGGEVHAKPGADGKLRISAEDFKKFQGEKGDKGDKGDRGQKGDSRNITYNVRAENSTVNAPGPSK